LWDAEVPHVLDFISDSVTVLFRLCKSVTQLPVVTNFKTSINPIVNPNTVSAH
jgi:surface protein